MSFYDIFSEKYNSNYPCTHNYMLKGTLISNF